MPDDHIESLGQHCRFFFDKMPKILKPRHLFCDKYEHSSDFYYGAVEFQGPHGPLPAAILTSKSHLPPNGYIFYIHGGPSGSIYTKGGIGRPTTVPSKIKEAIFECNLALVDIAYAGSMERSFYPDRDGKYAINELQYIIKSFELKNKGKTIIWGSSFGGPLALFLEFENIPVYLNIPVLRNEDIINHAKKYEPLLSNEQIKKLEYTVFSIEDGVLIQPKYPEFFESFYEGTKFYNIDAIDYLRNNHGNVRFIVFHELDEKVPVGKYRNELDQIGVNYTVIDGARHSSILGIEGQAANDAYQPLFDDICERSGWKDWTAADD